MRISGEYVAKTGDDTFCVADNDRVLKDALSQLDRKQRPQLNQDLQRAIQRSVITCARGSDRPYPRGAPSFESGSPPEWVGIGFWRRLSSSPYRALWRFRENGPLRTPCATTKT